MVDLVSKRCGHTNCNKWPSYGFAGGGRRKSSAPNTPRRAWSPALKTRRVERERPALGVGELVRLQGKTPLAAWLALAESKGRTATPSTQSATTRVQKGYKRARVAVYGAAAAPSPVTGGRTSASRTGPDDGEGAAETASLELGSAVKGEPAVACKVETAETQGVALSGAWATQPSCATFLKSCCLGWAYA